jgi:transcriptional regulator with XRE-family HTH domain
MGSPRQSPRVLRRGPVGGIERGERNPSLTNILRIADALGVVASAIHLEAERMP